MAAVIRSLRNGITPVVGASRDDLQVGDVVTVNSLNVHTTYSWSLAYKPFGSTAAFSGSAANPSPGSFVVDVEGPYLVRLVADLGLPTESEQFVRLRYLTVFGDLRLVAAGEQYGGTVNVPVDAAFTGWADEQNYNLTTLLGFLSRVSTSGRVLYVDANAGTEGYGDHSTIQAALDAAAAVPASPSDPWVVLVRPGTYTEDLTLRPNVHIAAWPGTADPKSNVRLVEVRGVHTVNLANAGDRLVVSGVSFTVHLAGTSPGISKTGPGSAYLVGCRVGVDVASPTQGPAVRLVSGPLFATDCTLVVSSANPDTVYAVQQLDGTLAVVRSIVTAPSGIIVPGTVPAGVTTTLSDTVVRTTGGVGAWGIRTDAETTTLEYSSVSGALGTGVPVVGVHVGAGVLGSGIRFVARWSTINGLVLFDTTGVVGATELELGAVVHYGFTFPAATPTRLAVVRADTLAYDNTSSGLTATDVQAAIDEIVSTIAPFTAGYTLEQAYNGGGPGAGRTIVADSGAVQILDAAFPSDPVPPGNTNGNLEVVGKVSVGALTKPEIDVDPNPYGAGPQVSMGWTVVPNNSPTGVGTATVVARSTEAPLYRNYDLRLGTQPASGGGKVGDVVVRAGDGTQGGVTTPDAGQVYVVAGSGLAGTADRGNIALVPGVNFAGAAGAVVVADPRTATPASVTAAGVCADPVGVTGTITFATDLGAVTASILAADTRAAAVAKLNALIGLSAVEVAGVITVSSRTTGPSARAYFLAASAGLDAAMGTFDGQLMVSGTYPDFVTVQATAANEVTVGVNGATGPLVYNADTGKLTVPGLIDPTGLVFEEAAAPATGATEGAVFVSDGSGGLTLGDLYYRGPGNAPPVSVGGGGGGASSLSATLVVGNDTGGTNIVLTSGDAILGESGVGVAGNVALQAGTDTGAGPTYGGDVILRPGQGVGGGTDGSVLLINAPATSGIRFNVTGTQELSIGTTFPLVYNATTGKLTVPGLIDPTGVVFEEAAAPTTGGTEGAIFVSDGTGGLTLGDLYYRGPSNAAPVSVSGVGAPVTTYVFRPGGIASGNVYTDFNLLYTALSAVDGPKTILFDDTITSPVLIPPKSGGGFYSFRNVTAQGLTSTPGNSTLPGPIVRFNNDGVNQAQCDSFFDESTNIAWESNTLAGSPAVVIADVLTSHITLTKCWVSTSGAAPFFYIDGGGGFPITGLFIRMLESSLSGTTPVTVQVVNGGSLAIDAYQQSKVNDSLSTDATSYASVSYDSTFKVFNPQTNCAVGTYDFTPISYTLSDVVELRDASPGGNSVILAVTGSEELSVGTTFPLVYDGATGKLTVPGVIDPTAVVFEQAPAPATGATEGAIFFSDGTGGLTAGNLYVRPASSGTPADLTTAAASGSDFYANVWVAWKKPCRVATTANVTTLAGGAPLSVDGVSVTTGDRVLVWVQTTGSENGIYRVTVPGTGSDGTWVRDTDFDASADVVGGCMVYVQDGSQNSRTRFTLVTTGTINLGVTSLTFLQEAPLVRTDATSTAIIAAGTAFTSGTIVWSSALDTRDYSEVSVWFGSTNIGSNTQVDLYVQWSDDGTTIPFGDDDGIQQTDFLLTTGTNGVFQPKNYVARLTTAGGELVANSGKLLSFPKKGGSMRFGVMGNSATGTFGVRAQRLA